MIAVLKKLRFLDNLEAHSFSDSILDFIKSMIIFYYYAHMSRGMAYSHKLNHHRLRDMIYDDYYRFKQFIIN